MISDDFKVVEMAESYIKMARSAPYFIKIWNTQELTFTKDNKLMPLFIGSVVSVKDNEDICGIISFNKKEKKCEITYAYPDIDENVMWKLDYGKYSCMVDRNLTVKKIDKFLASDLHDSEKAFNLVYNDIINNLEDYVGEDLTDDERDGFLEDICCCVSAEEIIKSVFIFSLLIEHYMHVHFHVVEKIVVVACTIMNRFISYNLVNECRCNILDKIIKIAIGNAMISAVKDEPTLYGIDENEVDFDVDEELMIFIEETYGGFKKMFQCFYPGITW